MAFELPPNSFSHTDLEASNKNPVYVAVAVGFVLATGGVILRGVARLKSKAAFGWDDYTIVFALILLYGLDITTILSAAKYGLGRHLPAVLSTVVPFQKISMANIAFWLATAAATKASLLLLYYRLFSPSRRFRFAVHIGAIIVFCQWFSLTLASIFQCRPMAAFWNQAIQDAKCIDLPRFTIVSGVLNLLTDILILCLPLPMVWGLNTTRGQKVTLTGMFLLGIFVCAISIIRLSKLAAVNYYDPTWRLVDVFVWTTLENGVGITSACLPTMRPLIGHFLPSASRDESYTRKGNGPSSQRATRTPFNRYSDDSDCEIVPHNAQTGSKDAWTSPDLAASKEIFNMNKATTKPFHSVDSTTRTKHQNYPATSSRIPD